MEKWRLVEKNNTNPVPCLPVLTPVSPGARSGKFSKIDRASKNGHQILPANLNWRKKEIFLWRRQKSWYGMWAMWWWTPQSMGGPCPSCSLIDSQDSIAVFGQFKLVPPLHSRVWVNFDVSYFDIYAQYSYLESNRIEHAAYLSKLTQTLEWTGNAQ